MPPGENLRRHSPSSARVVSASLHAVTFDTIWSSEVRAIHSARASLRDTQ